MIIHSISVEGYKMIGKKLSLDFPDSGRIGIQGVNESGKSTLLESLEFALYGPKRGAQISRDDTITWGKQKATFDLEFTTGSRRYHIHREFTATEHTADLTEVVDGRPDLKNAWTSLNEIEGEVEELTGMDRDSFTKLIYIKQKDLDALKGLGRAKREQLVNKIMGIDAFDSANELAKKAASENEDRASKLRIRMESVERNKASYEEKLEEKISLSLKVQESLPKLHELESKWDAERNRLEAYEWAGKNNALIQVLDSKNAEHTQVKANLTELRELRKSVEGNGQAISRFEELVKKLRESSKALAAAEGMYEEKESSLNRLKATEPETRRKYNLSTSVSLEQLSQAKGTYNKRFLVSLVVGVGLLFAAFLFNPLGVVGVVLLVFSAFWWTRYRKFDNQLDGLSELQSVSNQIRDAKAALNEAEANRRKLQSSTGFESSDLIDQHIQSISSEIKKTTGQDSIEGLVAVTSEMKARVRNIEMNNPEKRDRDLQLEINRLTGDLSFHNGKMPLGATDIVYDEAVYVEAKKAVENASNLATSFEGDISTDKALIGRLDGELAQLKPDYDAWPELNRNITEWNYKQEVLDRTSRELSETAKELRNRVIPRAKMAVTQVLPKLTNGRYSDFEIEEDLTFTVSAAGDYKAREMFSGGTQDQFLIALRLAFTESILDSRIAADRYCLLMDECISSSDEFRRQGIFTVLDLMKATFPQILIIAHEDISNFVDEHMILARDSEGYTSLVSKSWK